MIKNIKRIIFIMIIFLLIINVSNTSEAKTLNGRTLDELNTKIKIELIDNGCPESKANVRISESKGATVEWDNTSQNKHYKAKISNSVGSAAAAMGYQATITIEQTEIKSGSSTTGSSTTGSSTTGGSTTGGSTTGGSTTGGSTTGGSTSQDTQSNEKCDLCGGTGKVGKGGAEHNCQKCNGTGKKENTSSTGGSSTGGSSTGGSTSGGTSSGGSSESKEITTDSGQIIGNSLADLNTKIKNRLINNGCPENKAIVNITLAKGATVEWDNTSQNKHYKAIISNAMSSPTGAGNYQATVTIKTTEITTENTTSGGTSSGTDSTRPDRAPIQTPSREDDGKTEYTPGEIIDGAQGFIQTGENNGGNDKIKQDNMIPLSNTIYNILLVIGIVIALIVGLILGIKFVLGSLEEKAEIKTMLIPYIAGCLVVFGAFVIWKLIVDFLQAI